MENEIVITPKFIFRDYLKVNLYLFTISTYAIFSLIIDALFLAYFSYYYALGALPFSDFLLVLLTALVFYPMLVFVSKYIQTKRSLADPRLKENITFTINKDLLKDAGQNYSRNFFWSEILQIKETKSFFLIYITKHMVKVIRKADLKNNQYNELKALFNSLPIKKRLK